MYELEERSHIVLVQALVVYAYFVFGAERSRKHISDADIAAPLLNDELRGADGEALAACQSCRPCSAGESERRAAGDEAACLDSARGCVKKPRAEPACEVGVVRDDIVADEVVRAFYLHVVDIFFGYRSDGDYARPHCAVIHTIITRTICCLRGYGILSTLCGA